MSKTKESVVELLVTLLVKLLSIEKLWAKGLCASTYEASWLSKTWNSKVEDFTDRSQNVTRAFAKAKVKRLYKSPFQDGSEIRNITEDGNTSTLSCRDIKKQEQSCEGLTSVSCGQSKGKWSTEGWEGVCLATWGQPKEDGGPLDSPWSKG
ncbi:hypothetical protein KY290_036610 [Solanum tuberosum]|uniref:Uncharacterized protein n=1 Tax=Solanum tuberosum TaxID=4113 RepID=A0ABQ7TTN0_SOLTU|nr:hypothetical protein KY290_036610 [Solanum tuberosum]